MLESDWVSNGRKRVWFPSSRQLPVISRVSWVIDSYWILLTLSSIGVGTAIRPGESWKVFVSMLPNMGSTAVPLRIRIRQTSQTAVFSVHNFGNSTPPDQVSTSFEPYRRAVNQGGPGLKRVRGFTEAHGETVTLESSPDQGTSFTVTLPKSSQ